jgi:hypothetical protein
MKLMRTMCVLTTALVMVVLSASDAAAQAPTVTWQQVGNGLRVEWTAIPGATHYEAVVDGVTAPMPIMTTFFQVGPVPVGSYSLQIRAAAGATKGPLSAPVTVVIGAASPVCGAVAAPSVTASTSGMVANVNWNAVAGAIGYRLQVGTTPGATQYQIDLPAHQTNFSAPLPIIGTFYVRVLAGSACGALAPSNEATFTVGSPTPGPAPITPVPGSGPRTADPPPGQRLPLPGYAAQVVRDMANAYRGDLLNSCREHGGNNIFMFRVVQALRQRDSRWGLNWKRGNRGDLSQDIVTYNFGPGPDEDTTNVYIIDMIGGHCGSNPTWNWEDVTQKTADGGSIGRWTLLPYLRAGFPADPRP